MEIIPPDFLIIPYLLIIDQDINSIDEKVYGCIYWFSLLKRQKCTASNKSLAELLKSTPNSIGNSLQRLEEKGYIKRMFFDKSKRHRQEIIPLVRFAKVQLADVLDTPTDGTDTPVSGTDTPTDGQNNNNKKEKQKSGGSAPPSPPLPLKEKELTPIQEFVGYFTKRFVEVVSDTPPVINFPKVAKIGIPYLKSFGLEKMKELIEIYFSTDNKFYREVMWSIDVFFSSNVMHSLTQKLK